MALPFEYMETHGTGLAYAPFTYLDSHYVYPYADYTEQVPSTVEHFSLSTLNLPDKVGLYPTKGPNGLLPTEYKVNKEVMTENTRELLPTQQTLPPSRLNLSTMRKPTADIRYVNRSHPRPRPRQREPIVQSYVWHIGLLIFILYLVNE